MTKLTTKYMGVELKNPIIVGASNIVMDIDNIKLAEEYGAAAIVYKSLFEEQIQLEDFMLEDDLNSFNDRHAEMTKLFPDISHAGAAEYLVNLKKAVEAVKIPVFASLNAVKNESWVNYAKKMEETGVAGIELNFYYTPNDFDKDALSIENDQLSIISNVKKAINIPISIKISSFYSNPLNFIKKIDKIGVDSIVLFNRLFQPDIDIVEQKHMYPFNFSNQGDYNLSLRFAGLLYGNIKASISSATGIFDGNDAIKMLLAGADSVQVVSTLYLNKIRIIRNILDEIERWMTKKGYQSIEDFKGKLSKKNVNDPFAYQRAQYVDIIMRSNIFTKDHQL